MRLLTNRFVITPLLLALVAGGGLLYTQRSSNQMSPYKFQQDTSRGRFVVLQMHWQATTCINNIQWDLGSGRGGSGTFTAGSATKPWLRKSYAKPGAQITFGWMFPDIQPSRFEYELWLEGPNGEWRIVSESRRVEKFGRRGPFQVV